MKIDIGATQRCARGEVECGDAYAIWGDDPFCVVVADGLGHGPAASRAARVFCDFARQHLADDPVSVFRDATSIMAATRGTVASILRLDRAEGRLLFSGVGNVELVAFTKTPFRPVSSPGIVGRPLRRILTFEHSVVAGDVVMLLTDGVSLRFDPTTYHGLPVQELAERLVAEHHREHDDATCVALGFAE